MNGQDIYKIAVGVVMIHLMLLFIFEGFALTTNNPSNSVVLGSLGNITSDAGSVSNQIDDIGLCLEGTATQDECEERGCVWDNGQCYNAIEDRSGVDFGFFDVILSILKIPLYLAKFLVFIGSIVFFEIAVSFKLMPLIALPILRWFVTLVLWAYNIVVIYFLWAFISNWRGQR